jgi:hypothetical protein
MAQARLRIDFGLQFSGETLHFGWPGLVHGIKAICLAFHFPEQAFSYCPFLSG